MLLEDPLTTDVSNQGINTKITIDPAIPSTPNNLLGIALKTT
jgi:hypothetical protein